MRLIDADALIDDLMERYCKECNKRKGIKDGKYRIIYEIGEAPCRACEVDDVKAELEEAPTADVQENVKGEWIFSPDHAEGICTRCQYKIYGRPYNNTYLIVPYNFCPNCGASMERSE